jgi:hypothetical protein
MGGILRMIGFRCVRLGCFLVTNRTHAHPGRPVRVLCCEKSIGIRRKIMTVKFRRIVAATAVVGAAGLSALTAGSAMADPVDTPCTGDDVNVTVARDLAQPGEFEAFLVKYSAATPATSCTLQGPPLKVGLSTESGPVPGVVVESDDSPGDPVIVEGSMFGISRISQRTADAPNPVIPTTVELDLPGAPGSREIAAWPTGEPIKGSAPYATPVTQSAED